MSREEKCYVAKVGFTIGDTEQKIEPGTEIVFDGHRASIEGEEPVVLPRLRTVIKAGWLVEESKDDGAAFKPRSAEINVSPSTPNKEASTKFNTIASPVDEQIVGSFRNRDRLQKFSKDQANNTEQNSNDFGLELRDSGIEIRKLSSKNVGKDTQEIARVSSGTLSRVNKEIYETEDVKGESKTQSMLQEGIIFKHENISKEASGASDNIDQSDMITTPEQAIKVSSLNKRSNVNAIDVEVSKKPPAAKKISTAKKNTSSKSRRGRKPKIDEEMVAIAKKMCSNFPNSWDFYASTEEKTEAIQSFSEDPEIIQALYMAETQSFKRVIKQNYSELLS